MVHITSAINHHGLSFPSLPSPSTPMPKGERERVVPLCSKVSFGWISVSALSPPPSLSFSPRESHSLSLSKSQLHSSNPFQVSPPQLCEGGAARGNGGGGVESERDWMGFAVASSLHTHTFPLLQFFQDNGCFFFFF